MHKYIFTGQRRPTLHLSPARSPTSHVAMWEGTLSRGTPFMPVKPLAGVFGSWLSPVLTPKLPFGSIPNGTTK